jgi:hypothetical protein
VIEGYVDDPFFNLLRVQAIPLSRQVRVQFCAKTLVMDRDVFATWDGFRASYEQHFGMTIPDSAWDLPADQAAVQWQTIARRRLDEADHRN